MPVFRFTLLHQQLGSIVLVGIKILEGETGRDEGDVVKGDHRDRLRHCTEILPEPMQLKGIHSAEIIQVPVVNPIYRNKMYPTVIEGIIIAFP